MIRQSLSRHTLLTVALAAGPMLCFPPAYAQADDAAPATTAPASDDDQSVATVQTAVIHTGDIAQTLNAFGSITPEPAAVRIYSVPAEVRVLRLQVTAGQSVSTAAPLLEIEPSADTRLQLLDTRNALEAAKKDLADTQQRFNLKLATNTELLTAQQAVQSAQSKLDDFKTRGITDAKHTLTADADSIVSKIDVQPGQLIPPSGPLLELLPRNQITARLGIEPQAAHQLQIGQTVQLTIVGIDDPVAGKIHSISQQINPDTRLLDVVISLPPNAKPLLGSFVRGQISLQTQHALLVPRDAVLPADQGFTLFTVKAGHAVKHTVTVTLENDQDAAITAADLHDGDTVITQGNLELDDGAAVTTGDSK